MSKITKNPERLYYNKLFKSLNIPIINRTNPNDNDAYFINPVTGRSNEVSLKNLRRVINQLIREDIIDNGLLYNPNENYLSQHDTSSDSSNSSSSSDSSIDGSSDNDDDEEKIEDKDTYDNPTFSLVYNILKNNKGKSPIRIIIYKDGNIVIDKIYEVPNIGFAGYWDDISSYELMENSETLRIPVDSYIGNFSNHKYTMDVIKVDDIVGGSPIFQYFNYGIKNYFYKK